MDDVRNVQTSPNLSQSRPVATKKKAGPGEDYNQMLLENVMIRTAIAGYAQKAGRIMANVVAKEIKQLEQMQTVIGDLISALQHVKHEGKSHISWSDIPKSVIQYLKEHGSAIKPNSSMSKGMRYFFEYAEKGKFPPNYKDAEKQRSDAELKRDKLYAEAVACYAIPFGAGDKEGDKLWHEAEHLHIPSKPTKPSDVVKDILAVMQSSVQNLINEKSSEVSSNKIAVQQFSQFADVMLQAIGKAIATEANADSRINNN